MHAYRRRRHTAPLDSRLSCPTIVDEEVSVCDLIAVAYPDRQTAEEVRGRLGQLTREHAIELDDAVVVSQEQKGKVKLHQAVNPAAHGAAGGAPDKVLAQTQRYGGEVLQTSLDNEAETSLREALPASSAGASGT